MFNFNFVSYVVLFVMYFYFHFFFYHNQAEIRKLMRQLEKDKVELQGQLRDLEWRLDNESKVCFYFLQCAVQVSLIFLPLEHDLLNDNLLLINILEAPISISD